jgi:hypothetical protein
MTQHHRTTAQQRMHLLEQVGQIARRELNIVSLQLLAVVATSDEVNYPRVKSRRHALLLTIDRARDELELLYEAEEGNIEESR